MTEREKPQQTNRELFVELAKVLFSALAALLTVIGSALDLFTNTQPEGRLRIIVIAFAFLFLLIVVPVYVLKKRPAKVALLKKQVIHAFFTALDNSPFNPETRSRS